jgi:hypothetical protein
VDSKYNLIATVNNKPSKKNDGHYTAVNNSPTLGSWYKYDDNIVNLVKIVKGSTNSVLMDFQKTAFILFYINLIYVSVCYNNLCNEDEVIDCTRHERPPIIVQLQDANSSLSSSNTSSSSLSDTLPSLLSDNSSRSLTSVRSKTNSDDDSVFLSSSQSTKYGKSNSSENKCANYVLSFGNWAMGTMSEICYNNPHQERCVGKMCGEKMSHCKHEGCKVRVHNICRIDWLM